MKIESVPNQLVTRDFFKAIQDIIAENTSFNYSTIALNGIKAQLSNEFGFIRDIRIKKRSIHVNSSINSVDKRDLRKFFIKTINMMGPSYLKALLSRRLTQKDLMYMENIGIRFN